MRVAFESADGPVTGDLVVETATGVFVRDGDRLYFVRHGDWAHVA